MLKPEPSAVAANDLDAAEDVLTAQQARPTHRLALVLKADAARVLLFEETSSNPFEAALGDFELRFAGQVVLVSATEKVPQILQELSECKRK